MAGFSEKEMKSLLKNKDLPDNIILPKEFEVRDVIMHSPVSNISEKEDKVIINKNRLSAFNTDLKLNVIEAQRKIDLDFTTTTRRDRVNLIAKSFSKAIDKVMLETQNTLSKRIEESNENGDLNTSQELQFQLDNLKRIEVIKDNLPAKFFKEIFDGFKGYVDKTDQERIDYELGEINKKKAAANTPENVKLKIAKDRSEYKNQEYKKIIDNFEELAKESTFIIAQNEEIKIDVDGYNKEIEDNPSQDRTLNPNDEDTTSLDFEEKYKEGWMSNFQEVSSHESLSHDVRKFISNIPKLNFKGTYELDDLGNPRYLDSSAVHAILITELSGMTDSKDLYPYLEKLSKKKAWVKQVIKALKSDNLLESKFFHDFRKDHTIYSVSLQVKQANGQIKSETKVVNSLDGKRAVIGVWRDNIESGTVLDNTSVYDTQGKINEDNAKLGEKWTNTLTNVFSNKSNEEILNLLKEEKYFNTIIKLMNMIGIDTNPGLIQLALTDPSQFTEDGFNEPFINDLLSQFNIIFSQISKGKYSISSTGEVDLISNFSGVYNRIASIIDDVSEESYESSFRESGKSRYAHTTPNYLGSLIKDLKNTNPNRELSPEDKVKYGTEYNKFLTENYKQYQWFYENGEWKNQWLKDLENDKEVRNNFGYHANLKHGNLEYSSWDSLDVITLLLAEYNAPLNDKKSNKYANYHMPIYSDTASAEFITQKKYVDYGERDENGRKLTFEEALIPKYINLIQQEYQRIMLVRARDEAYRNGEDISLIANFDISRGKDGKIKSKGGSEFKFLEALNNIKFDGKDFVDKMYEIANNEGGRALNEFLTENLYKILDEGFQDTLNNWITNGLLETVEHDGKELFKYFPESFKDREKVIRDLKEYYWNSKFATSQIIQLTTTDLAFYKNLEDFQKRFKQLHAPALKLNTQAKFNGKPEGKEFERTIYLKDDEVISNTLKEVKDITESQYQKGFLTKMDRDSIINKFENVNVADAQAYRSLPSYRSIRIMTGSWSDSEQNAYENIIKGEWNIKDFDTIWQTIKPYVYTQVFNDSGIEGKGGIKTPIQHKNSEFPLFAIYSMMASSLGQSDKLKAINQFMIDADVDVIQFESTTKVGKQGVIDINDKHVFENTYNHLARATGMNVDLTSKDNKLLKINSEQFDPNVLHTIPYKDYGIQVATPEHVIDKEQLMGTQIRKLIMADISPEAVLTVGDKVFQPIKDSSGNIIKTSKDQVLDLYNKLITENVIDSYKEAKEIFDNNKEIEKALLSEVRGNPRYGSDMVQACTLNEKGEFNIPLFDPVQSQRIQTLLNSIIKSRITKQKVKGGALIQVSNYGLTEELNVRYFDKNNRFIFNETEWNKGDFNKEFTKDYNRIKQIYSSFDQYKASIETDRIAYHECYLPAYSKQFYDILQKSGMHEMDVDKLPDELRKIVGYRVPSEDKYSIFPLFIKGFLPQQNGSSIMLPSDGTVIAGFDYDKI